MTVDIEKRLGYDDRELPWRSFVPTSTSLTLLRLLIHYEPDPCLRSWQYQPTLTMKADGPLPACPDVLPLGGSLLHPWYPTSLTCMKSAKPRYKTLSVANNLRPEDQQELEGMGYTPLQVVWGVLLCEDTFAFTNYENKLAGVGGVIPDDEGNAYIWTLCTPDI